MRQPMKTWITELPVGHGGLGTLSAAPVYSGDWSSPEAALTNMARLLAANLHERVARARHTTYVVG